MAHKKGQGSTRNGRDSNPQCRGVKRYAGETGRSRGTSSSVSSARASSPARACGMGRDYTLFAVAEGVVEFHENRSVHVKPVATTTRRSRPQRSAPEPDPMFIDERELVVRSGKGGDGRVAWRREKRVPRGGPAGGDGGHGGSVILLADPQLTTFGDMEEIRVARAADGEPGGTNNRSGASGHGPGAERSRRDDRLRRATGRAPAPTSRRPASAGPRPAAARAGAATRHFATATNQRPTAGGARGAGRGARA